MLDDVRASFIDSENNISNIFLREAKRASCGIDKFPHFHKTICPA
jgi:hypothetical protein